METTREPDRPFVAVARDIETVLRAFYAPGDSLMNEETVGAAERLAEDAERILKGIAR